MYGMSVVCLLALGTIPTRLVAYLDRALCLDVRDPPTEHGMLPEEAIAAAEEEGLNLVRVDGSTTGFW
jgi:hypothetical protein